MAKQPGSTIPRYKRKRRRSLPRRIFGWIVKLVLVFFVGSILWVLAYRFIPPPITVTMLGDLVGGRGVEKDWMSIRQIDRDMVRAAIGAEDGKFCQHEGFDWDAISAAAQRNASGGRIRGGSTISQQTAKNAFLWQGGGYFRKGLEAWFTLLIETIWGKQRIMEVYLNVVEWGPGIYGAEAAARHYFQKPAGALTIGEAVRLAAVLPDPLNWSPLRPTRRVVARDAAIYSNMPAVFPRCARPAG